jgi:uncharacterized protein with GYD domain
MSSIRCREFIVKTFIILLQRMERLSKRKTALSLEPDAIGGVAECAGVRVLDIVVTLGDFDTVLVLGASDNASVASFLDELDGWRTVALLATSHSRYELSYEPRSESRSAE